MAAAVMRLAAMQRGARVAAHHTRRAMHSSTLHDAYDVVVVGGGHAGCEAASGAARVGARTLLVTQRRDTIGVMSCNPSIGGIGKGQMVREVDALGGVMGRVTDRAGIQFRILNRSKGPAVQSPRAQADRELYRTAMLREMEHTPNLHVLEASVEDLTLRDGAVSGVVLQDGSVVPTHTAVLTTGTFLRACIHIGKERQAAGRLGDAPSIGLAHTLERAGFTLGRLTTGTPPRLDGRTIDYSALEAQPGDDPPMPFSFANERVANADNQVACHATHTTPECHAICAEHMHELPDFDGHEGKGRGPRYCPSLEAKVRRFPDRAHHVWLEPEGYTTPLVYPAGLNTAFPPGVQERLLRAIPGLERVEMTTPGYAVEYEYVDPRHLHHSLQTRDVAGLFLAGQINGTTGYEEAAGQGLVAGVNAGIHATTAGSGAPLVLDRAQGYIGVLIDDLVTLGTKEPYRMFTSRAEYRLTLRADNADERLTPLGHAVGCVSDAALARFAIKKEALDAGRALVARHSLSSTAWKRHGFPVAQDGRARTAAEVLGYNGVSWDDFARAWPDTFGSVEGAVRDVLATEGKYHNFLQKQQRDIASFRRDESLVLPAHLCYADIPSLSGEEREKLEAARPPTLAAASRISGITPATLMVLLRYTRRKKDGAEAPSE